MINILSLVDRKKIIEQIESEENKRRKAESEKRYQVMSDNQRPYVLQQLKNEFSPETVAEMRTVTSINITKRVVNAMASIYRNPPERTFSPELPKNIEQQVKTIFEDAKINVKLKDANKKFKLHNQCAIQVLPREGKIDVKVLRPHHYDVIPDPLNEERALAYILSGYDKWIDVSQLQANTDIQGSTDFAGKNQPASDGQNEDIADRDDWQTARAGAGKVYVWWTKELHFRTNGEGVILDPVTVDVQGVSSISNPIQMLPFVDISGEKDLEFWTSEGSNAVEFNLDFSVVLSDTCNTNRLQGYAQSVITSVKKPETMMVGPARTLWLPLDPNHPELKPTFAFESPQPDLAASLNLQDRLLSYFLTTNGVDAKTISGTAQVDKYSSGYERMLAMLDKFEASQDDYDLFAWVECETFELVRAWNNRLQGTALLDEKYQGSEIPEETKLVSQFQGPQLVQTKTETEDSVIKRYEAGLCTLEAALMELYGIDEAAATKMAEEINAQQPAPVAAQTINPAPDSNKI